ncbi:MAG: protein kinase [Dehalococcoidia bacterium]|nr:protein kinase [Dehalococcoidia bacterium]
MTDFELLEKLGSGGMGTVWRARDTASGAFVALKMLHPHLSDEPDYLRRFEREVEVSQRIDSPHVVRVLGYGIREGQPFMAMELVEGPSLRDLLRDRHTLPWEEARGIAAQAARGLGAAHAHNVVHRDIKPSNILMSPGGAVKVADFGVARAGDLSALTGASAVIGTVAYMAPEDAVSAQSDFYALGIVLYEMLAGAPPFTGDSQKTVLMKHLRDAPDLARVPATARPVLESLLGKDPAARPRDAAALLALLGITASAPPRQRGEPVIGAAAPAWHHAEGDPDSTARYWNGLAWQGGPVRAVDTPRGRGPVIGERPGPPALPPAPASLPGARAGDPVSGHRPAPAPFAAVLPVGGPGNAAWMDQHRIVPPPAIDSARNLAPNPAAPAPHRVSDHGWWVRSIRTEGRINRTTAFWLMVVAPVAAGALVSAMLSYSAALWLSFFMCWIWMAAGARRMHDLGVSGWYALLMLLPVLGIAFWFICFLGGGESETNRFGPPPPRGFRI